MSEQNKYKIDSVEELLAHSISMEMEAGERYTEIADAMAVHNNQEVADLFKTLAGYANMHAAEMEKRAQTMTLPHIAPWNFIWADSDSPEAANIFQTHYKMTPYHVLQLAMQVEKGAYDFYSKIATDSENKDVVAMASEFAEEEKEHVTLLEGWTGRFEKPADDWDEDLDPPMTQE